MTNSHNNGFENAARSNGSGAVSASQPNKVKTYLRRWATFLFNLLRHLRRNEHRHVDIDGDDLNRVLTAMMEDGHHITQADLNIRAEYPDDTDSDVDKPPSPSDGNDKKYKKAPFHFVNTEWGLGWTDGRSGQPLKLSRTTLEAAAQLELKERVHAIKQLIALKLTRFTALQELLAKRDARLKTKEETYEELLKKRNGNYLEFSRPLGYLYLVFAILLFLADVPLS